jgi:type VI secretion system secreted protein VgrG
VVGSILTQLNRRLKLTTNLGPDVLLIKNCSGYEALSELFHFQVEAFAANASVVDFAKVLGQPASVSVALDSGGHRFFHGIVNRITRGNRGFDYTSYRLEIVPKIWMLTRIHRSRIFQHITVPDILKAVFSGFEVSFQLSAHWELRDYCVQYRESDFEFASRLMEEEGIFYFFKVTADRHELIVADAPAAHPDLPRSPTLYYDEISGGRRGAETIHYWEKSQEIRTGTFTLWDHCFELPHKHLEAAETIQDEAIIGRTTHQLNVAAEQLEHYDHPGAYAQRFDGVSPSGGEQPAEIEKIHDESSRTVSLRAEEEAAQALRIRAQTMFPGIHAGFKFTLARHFQDDGTYVVTHADFAFTQAGSYQSGDEEDDGTIDIQFTALPASIPFRPLRKTPKPNLFGSQTAVVVGPPGEEIYTDKYGRIRVQFHWDRAGQMDADSSCWVRVATAWAGKNWGFFSLPRIGHEVVISFEEGDPDRPLVTGSVYNADMMPPYKLPESKTVSTWKSRSSVGGGGFNELRYEDKKGEEQIFLHAERNLDERIKANRLTSVGNDHHTQIARDNLTQTGRDQQNEVGQDLLESIKRDHAAFVFGKQSTHVYGAASRNYGSSLTEVVENDSTVNCYGNIYFKSAKTIILEAASQISLKVGDNFIDIGPSGITIKGTTVLINSGGAAGSGTLGKIVELAPLKNVISADNSTPGGTVVYQPTGPGPNSPENRDKTHWVAIELIDNTDRPIPNQAYRIVLPDGSTTEGTLNSEGKARVEGIDPGQCQVSFPGLADWEKV